MRPEDAHYPLVKPRGGHYESFYLKCADPAGGRALWLRYTVHKRPGEPAVGSLWATLFDADGPHAAKVTLGPDQLGCGGADWLRIGGARIGADGCQGAIPASALAPGRAGRPTGANGAPSDASPASGTTPPTATGPAPPPDPGAAPPADPGTTPPTATGPALPPDPGAAPPADPGATPPTATGPAPAAAWELTFAGDAPPFPYLPHGWMYTAPLPRTKALSLRPAIRVSGTATVRGRTIQLDGWPGMVGHNWGAEHAERWIWMHGTAFDQQPDAWLDVTVGRVRIGRWTTPWVANGCLSLDGVRHRLGGLGRVRAVAIDERAERAAFTLPGEGIVVRGEVSAPRELVVGWVYSDPRPGSDHHTAHCAIADMTLTVLRDGEPPRTLAVAAGATYELGMRERDHGITIQPFSDP